MIGLFRVGCLVCWNLDFRIYIRCLYPVLSHTLLRASVWISHITHTFQMRDAKHTSFLSTTFYFFPMMISESPLFSLSLKNFNLSHLFFFFFFCSFRRNNIYQGNLALRNSNKLGNRHAFWDQWSVILQHQI